MATRQEAIRALIRARDVVAEEVAKNGKGSMVRVSEHDFEILAAAFDKGDFDRAVKIANRIAEQARKVVKQQ